MPLTLHAAFVPSALQMLGTTHHLLDKAESWCAEKGTAEAALLEARIHPEMYPLSYQIKSVAVHTAGALAGVAAGVFAPDLDPPPGDFAGLRARIDSAIAEVSACDPDALDAKVGAPMRFAFRDFRLDFTAEDFLLSFSQPNFYFHVATAYDVLRKEGVEIGKRDFMGALRLAR